jgi:hypothetical protein
MLKGLLGKARCSVGVHTGDWIPMTSQPCTIIRACTRCGDESRKINHDFGDWAYTADGSCLQARDCSVCDESLTRSVHQWGQPQYQDEVNCIQAKTCERCGQAERVAAVHIWGPLEYSAPDTCEQVGHCQRCATRTLPVLVHAWGDWQLDLQGNSSSRVCRRCGDIGRRVAEPTAAPDQPGLRTQITRISEVPGAPASELSNSPTGNAARPAVRNSPERAAAFAALGTKWNGLQDSQEAFARILETLHANAAATIEKIGPTPGRETQAAKAETPEPAGSPSAVGSMADVLGSLQVSDHEVREMLERAAALQAKDSGTEIDPELIGHWRGTDILSSGGMSLITDLQLDFAGDGNFVYATQSSGPAGSSPLELSGEGTWSTSAGMLTLDWIDKGTSVRRFYIENSSLLFPDEANWPRLWHRG